MKKYLIAALLIAGLILPSTIHAQVPATYTESVADYNQKVQTYNKAHETYVLRRSQYIKFKSLQSQKDAHDATAAMLQARDDVVVSYINSLKKRMQETPGVTPELAKTLTIQLDAETTFFTNHKARVPSTGTLEDLVADSNLAKEEYTKAQNIFYQTLFAISGGKVTDLRTRLGDNFTSLKSKVESIRAESRPEYIFDTNKIQSIDRFIFESTNKFARADEKKLLADDLKDVREFTGEEYGRRLSILGETQQLLKDASSFLKEIINQIKNQ